MRPIAATLLVLVSLGVSVGKAEPAGGAVRLIDKGAQVLLDNGIVSALVNKSGGSIASLRFHDTDLARPNGIYFSMDGGEDYRTPGGCQFRVKTQTPDMAEVVCKRVWKDEPQAFDIEMHFILRRGDSGVYVYAVLDHPESYPATSYGEWRMVWKTAPNVFDNICVDDARQWRMPDPDDYRTATPTGIKEIVRINDGPRSGTYDCKYDFNASYYDLGCWGHAGARSKLGGWIVCGGYDFFNDGPTKQDLNAAAGINHIHFGMNHYNGSNPQIAAGEIWSKMYGPYLLYCNADQGGVAALWKDAKARVQQEKAAWPYAWVTDERQYPPAADRGSVGGRFFLKDALKPKLTSANAWIGLAQPDAGGNWQFESKRYQYWARVGADGRFNIPSVRSGDYTLYAFATGVVGEFAKTDIHLDTGQAVDAGDVTWIVPHVGKSIAWEIGVPDRTAREFRHGDDYFHGYVWQNFAKEFTNPLEYIVGRSDPAKDWNYAQTGYGEGAKLVPWKWRIHFHLAAAPKGDATLVLAFASADRAHVEVCANDESKPVTVVTPEVQGGNALLRESIHAKYCVSRVSIPKGNLHAGDNVISLAQTSTKGPGFHVMYDYLSLELP